MLSNRQQEDARIAAEDRVEDHAAASVARYVRSTEDGIDDAGINHSADIDAETAEIDAIERELNPFPVFALEDIAAAGYIARMEAQYPADVAELRATLAAVTPNTIVDDECGDGPRRMLTLAAAHKDSAADTGHAPMTDAQAWEWAVRDLVFGGFAPVPGLAYDAETDTIVETTAGDAVCLGRGYHNYGPTGPVGNIVRCLDCPDSYVAGVV